MKKFVELEFVQNLTWKQVITYSAITLTTLTSAIWVIATRMSDSKAEYVNMRYGEIALLEEQVKTLQDENLQLKSKLGVPADKPIKKNIENKIQEMEYQKLIYNEEFDLFYMLTYVESGYVYIKFNFNNGTQTNPSIDKGSSYIFMANNKKYQLMVTDIDYKNKKIKYLIREIPNSN